MFRPTVFLLVISMPSPFKLIPFLKLYEAYGKPGVVSAEIVSTMGPSDEIPDAILARWRGYHDYIWFRVNMKTDKVKASEFYAAYE
ncbi:hypothetical protein BG003_000414 [Podila horticola]|nr:hypothetical protein BG003_000414 [Podila horticola]